MPEETLEEALARALGALRRRERTVAELRGWLLERGLSPDVVEDAIAELIRLGELDDERFALAFAADKRDLSGWGSERIAAALLDRGVDRALVEAACREEREEELGRAVALLGARGEQLGEERERARALAYLTRRGYGFELAHDAIRMAGSEGLG